MLKPASASNSAPMVSQPPSGGCVLKQQGTAGAVMGADVQPPSGGCVLKHPTGAVLVGYQSSRLRAAVC